MIALKKHRLYGNTEIGLVGLRMCNTGGFLRLWESDFTYVSLDTPLYGELESVAGSMVLCNHAMGRGFILGREPTGNTLECLRETFDVEELE